MSRRGRRLVLLAVALGALAALAAYRDRQLAASDRELGAR
jgi:hypothetical protein